jgi:hypothetical protein
MERPEFVTKLLVGFESQAGGTQELAQSVRGSAVV